jgi:hypothetical protein
LEHWDIPLPATRESIVKSGNNCRLKEKGAIMNQKFERIARHLYQRKYRTAAGDWTTLYYARFVCRLKGESRVSIDSGCKSRKRSATASPRRLTLPNGRRNTRRLMT